MAYFALFILMKFQPIDDAPANDRANKVDEQKKPLGYQRKRRATKTSDNEKKRYSCDICNSSFYHATNLSSHIKVIHKGIRPHVCKLCNKRFPNAFSLKRHTISHTGMRW